MKDAQGMMNEMMKDMDPEDKKMMDSLGIKMPDMKSAGKNLAGVSDKKLAEAWEDENRIAPKKDASRIASIAKGVTAARIPAYVKAIQTQLGTTLDANTVTQGDKVYQKIKAKAKNGNDAAAMSSAFWASGHQELTVYLLGKVCADYPTQYHALNNYAAVLTMLNGEHLAIPILEYLNTSFRRNTTVMNNLGQAWFGLGDLTRAQNYLDSVTDVYTHHPQATLTQAAIEESKGNTKKAAELVKKSIKHAYTKEKEEKLAKLSEKIGSINLRVPFKPSSDPLGLGNTRRPDYPNSIAEINALLPMWEQFNDGVEKAISKTEKEIAEETALYAKTISATAGKAMAAIQQTIQTGEATPVNIEPLYARKAGLQVKQLERHYAEKMKKLTESYMKLQSDLTEIRKNRKFPSEYEPCSVHRDAINDMLKKLNMRKKEYDEEALTVFKHYANDFAYWAQYTTLDIHSFRVIELQFKLFWLQKNKELQPLDMQTYKNAYASCEEKAEGQPGKLSEFDDVACNYKAEIDLGFVTYKINCSHSSATIEFNDNAITFKQLGNKYTGSTVKINSGTSAKGRLGPLEIKGAIGSDFTYELDENNELKDWKGTANASVEGSVGVDEEPISGELTVKQEFELEMSKKAGIGDFTATSSATVKAGIGNQELEAGIQKTVSIISGHGTVSGTGIAKGIIIRQW
ncbi:hypothetical protein MKQ68_25355 [Chitinophaga horti]|uniref:Tetratricopeptide repeat-containing protein n=1 Tax=Chitinophaga horti TaxID=2920382 RepID=A0ABY6J164_9BACT|nr:hypothetical protein [Chitinophaga horti]UYQ93413.1 hypothetical protein MKQ68_25355 [Chitinophaga horti]